MYPGHFAEREPDKPALIMSGSGEVVTYATLEARSRRLAQLLWDRGLRPGDGVALYAECHARYFEVLWAALRSGLLFTPVNRHFRLEEAAYIVDNCKAKAFISTAALAAVAAGVRDQASAVQVYLMMDGALCGFESYESTIARYPPERLVREPLGTTLMYSSGSTGRPKAIVYQKSARRLEDGPEGLEETWTVPAGVDQNAVILIGAALHHAAPLVHSYWTQCLGGTVVVQEHFDAKQMLRLIERYEISHGFFVPTMFVRLSRLPPDVRSRYDISSMRFAVHAGAPCPVEVKRQMIDWWGPVLEEYYAATEGNGMTWIDSADWLRHPGSVGRAISGRVHIVDDDGRDLSAGQVGTVYFSGAGRFEYLGDPEKTAQCHLPDGRSTVGDVGYVDDEGYLYLIDRKSFTIVSGGVNIYPKEIEDCLIMHPAVEDVAVFGVPDAEFGEAVKAVVQLRDPSREGPQVVEEIVDYCRERLARFKCPRSVDFIAEMPRQPSGKLHKRKLRDPYWAC